MSYLDTLAPLGSDPRKVQPKSAVRPAKLQKADREKIREQLDEAENKKVRTRSRGQCELIELHPNAWSSRSYTAKRCRRRAVHVHHTIGGWGKRARGASALAENKLHLCASCHSDVHAHVLVPDGQYFRRVK